MKNHTLITTFLLMRFSDVRKLQILHFFVFLLLYLMSIIGNLLIITAVALDYHLHTPMYFFLSNLAMLDLGSVSVTVPKSMAMSLMDDSSITYAGCVAQVFCYLFFLTAGFCVLIMMAHDRYIAICNPLQYERIMHKGACIQMVAVGYFSCLCYALLHTVGTFANTFSSNTVHQFFCEIPQLLKLSCSNLYLMEVVLVILSCSFGLGSLIFITKTYVQIFSAVLRIPSVHGQKKAFSTCIPHLIVVSMFVLSAACGNARPPTDTSSILDVAFAVLYAVIPPLLNPFIYSMRNQELKSAVWKLIHFHFSS